MVKKNDIVEIVIDEVLFPNKGRGKFEDTNIIVKNTVLGQKVSARINKKKKSSVEGRLLEVLEKSPVEIEPKCPHFEFCGGCTYQQLKHDDELKLKENQVLKLFKDGNITDFEYLGIEPSPKLEGYRNKCEFSFGDEEKGGDLALGMRKRMSYYEVVTLTDCNIVDRDFISIIKTVLDFFKERNVPFYHKMRHEGVLRHLVVRKSEAYGEILINLVTSSEYTFSRDEFKNDLLETELEGSICGILHTINDGLADVVKSDSTEVLYGKDYFMEKLFDLDFKVSTFSFFQTNSKGAEKLYSIVRDFAGDAENKVVFDLYCGTGTIGQIMSEKSKKVIGIEIVEEAVMAANENAKMNGISNCEFIAGDVLKKVDELTDKPDIIIVDPPRDGIHPKAIGKIIDFNAPEIVYVSCKPTSLVRDLQIFEESGYKTKKVKLMDMFPRTVHVETVVLLSQQKPDDTIEIDLDLDELDATAAETKATYEEIKAYVWEKHNMKVSSLYISQVKRKCGLEVGQNYNLSKSENPKVPKCPAEKEAAIMNALKHFQMI